MPHDAVSATLFMAYGDSNLLERLQPDGARAIRFFFPRGQPCLVCWLVSPPKWRETSLPVAVPIPGPALGCFCACALGRHAPRWRRHMTPRATRPRVKPPLTTNLLGPSQTRNLLTKPPGGSQQDLNTPQKRKNTPKRRGKKQFVFRAYARKTK